MNLDRDIWKQGFMRAHTAETVKLAKAKARADAKFDESAWARRCVEDSRKAYARMWGDDWATQSEDC